MTEQGKSANYDNYNYDNIINVYSQFVNLIQETVLKHTDLNMKTLP